MPFVIVVGERISCSSVFDNDGLMPDFIFRRPFAVYAFYGPPGLPRPIVSRLADEIGKAVMAPEVKARLKTLSIAPTVTSPDEFAAMVQEISTTFQTIIKAGNIK